MTDADDPLRLLCRALEQTGDVLSRVRPEQATLPTPCRSWDVRTLVNHVVHDVNQYAAMAAGASWEQSSADVIGDDWLAAYRAGADTVEKAWRRPGAVDGVVALPWGEAPATWRVDLQTVELTVHSWDIARATGQGTELDPELGELALTWGGQNLKPEFRGDEASGRGFGPQVPVPDNASLYDRVAAFFGRNPA